MTVDVSTLDDRIGCIVGRVIGAIPPMQVECMRRDIRALADEQEAEIAEQLVRIDRLQEHQ